MPDGLDFTVENHGSIFLLKPQNNRAVDWVHQRIGQKNGFQPYFPTVVVEQRYIADIVSGIRNEGWVVSA